MRRALQLLLQKMMIKNMSFHVSFVASPMLQPSMTPETFDSSMKKKEEIDAREQHEKDFLAFDINQDNYVDASEVRQVHKNLRQEDISAFFIAADVNEDGLITLEEYVNASLADDEDN